MAAAEQESFSIGESNRESIRSIKVASFRSRRKTAIALEVEKSAETVEIQNDLEVKNALDLEVDKALEL